MAVRLAAAFTTCQIALGVIASPQGLTRRLTRRKIIPLLMPAAVVHSSTAHFTQFGTGTVRMCFPLPTKSAITQCSSRIWKSSVSGPTSSARRNPHPMRNARIARSRFPRRSSAWSWLSKVLDCSTVNQLPIRMPRRFAPLRRRMPAASSGLRRPVSEAS